jgi:hypothetical protein
MAGDGATKDNAKTVLVRQGDYLAKLAYAHDLDPEDIWNDPANAELTTLRLDPNLLAPGDRIYIPVKPRAALPIQKGTTNRYTATVPRVPVTIRFAKEPRPPGACRQSASEARVHREEQGRPAGGTPVQRRDDGREHPLPHRRLADDAR